MTRISIIIAFSALLLAASCNERVVVKEPQPPADGEPIVGADVDPLYVGRWAADKDWCDAPSGEGPIEFTRTQFIGAENVCDIQSSQEGTEGGWRLDMICQAEGETVSETFDVDLDGRILRVSRNGGEPVEFESCADAAEQE